MTEAAKTKTRKTPMTAAERKRAQVARDRAAGFREVKVKIPEDKAAALRAFARSLMSGAHA